MHNAPSVSYPLGRSRFAGALLLSAWLLGVLSCFLWWRTAPVGGWRFGAAVLALLATGAWAAWQWWRSPGGVLVWDQEHWSWSAGAPGHGGAPQVSLDLQHWLLLRWREGASSHWLWLERASRPARWADLRRAVYSRARPQARPESRPSAAKP